MELKNKYLVVPITILIVGIVTIILAIVGIGWYYYLLGALVGIMCHALLIRQSAKIERLTQLDPEGTKINPRSLYIPGLLARFGVFISVFLVLAYKASTQTEHNMILLILIAFFGYLTLKAVLIVTLLLYRKKVEE